MTDRPFPVSNECDRGSPAIGNQTSRFHPDLSWLLVCGACYSILLCLTISGWSLWTDEAFSAYIASHTTLKLLVTTLAAGDSSDLQTAMYYLYLHWWTGIFGISEVALRSANIPFIVTFAFALPWISWRAFRSRWLWIVPASLPFLWAYAPQVRAYFSLIAFSTVCLGCLLAYLHRPSERERRVLPWILLGSLFAGTTFDMLMLLAVPPMVALMATYDRRRIRSADWTPSLKAFAFPFLALFSYLAWTFGRGTAYDYAKPGVLSMASVFYRFVGLLGYGPNRRYDTPFHPYLFGMVAAALVLLAGVTAAVIAGMRGKGRPLLISLSWGLALAVIEVVVLSVIIQQQIELRHLAALVPLLVIWPLAALVEPLKGRPSKLAWVSVGLLIAVWLVADYRLLFLSEYKEEDFRSAVNKAIELHRQFGAEIALVGDPAAGAYYGLDLHGEKPCFPLTDDCGSGFRKTSWPRNAPAAYAMLWKQPQVYSWLASANREHVPTVVIMSRSRHPIFSDSAWWPILRSKTEAYIYSAHGFWIYFLEPNR